MSRFLLEAASKGDAKKVQEYLDKGPDIGWYQKERGRTALTEAAINGRLEVARILVDRGADINWRDFAVGFTPLGWASECNHPSLVEFFLKEGADPNLVTHEFFVTPLRRWKSLARRHVPRRQNRRESHGPPSTRQARPVITQARKASSAVLCFR